MDAATTDSRRGRWLLLTASNSLFFSAPPRLRVTVLHRRSQLADPRAQLLGHGQAAQQRGRLLELAHHRVDGLLAVAAHDAVEGAQEVLLDGLVRGVADVLLGDRTDARGQID